MSPAPLPGRHRSAGFVVTGLMLGMRGYNPTVREVYEWVMRFRTLVEKDTYNNRSPDILVRIPLGMGGLKEKLEEVESNHPLRILPIQGHRIMPNYLHLPWGYAAAQITKTLDQAEWYEGMDPAAWRSLDREFAKKAVRSAAPWENSLLTALALTWEDDWAEEFLWSTLFGVDLAPGLRDFPTFAQWHARYKDCLGPSSNPSPDAVPDQSADFGGDEAEAGEEGESAFPDAGCEEAVVAGEGGRGQARAAVAESAFPDAGCEGAPAQDRRRARAALLVM